MFWHRVRNSSFEASNFHSPPVGINLCDSIDSSHFLLVVCVCAFLIQNFWTTWPTLWRGTNFVLQSSHRTMHFRETLFRNFAETFRENVEILLKLFRRRRRIIQRDCLLAWCQRLAHSESPVLSRCEPPGDRRSKAFRPITRKLLADRWDSQTRIVDRIKSFFCLPLSLPLGLPSSL